VIDANREAVLRRALPGLARKEEAMVHAIGVMPDHVHVVVSIPPKVAISKVVNRLKGSSRRLLGHDEQAASGEPWIRWQSEYGLLSFAESNLKAVVAYVTHKRCAGHGSVRILDPYPAPRTGGRRLPLARKANEAAAAALQIQAAAAVRRRPVAR